MNIKTDTIIRTIVLFVTIVNNLLTAFNKNPLPFSESDIYGGLSLLASTLATLWAWWKNNSFTVNARKADEVLAELKKGKSV